jgi:hypothetical protein
MCLIFLSSMALNAMSALFKAWRCQQCASYLAKGPLSNQKRRKRLLYGSNKLPIAVFETLSACDVPHLSIISGIECPEVLLCAVWIYLQPPQWQRCSFYWHRFAAAHILQYSQASITKGKVAPGSSVLGPASAK